MFRSYCKIGWRSLVKNRLYSIINVTGLAIGLACCMVIGFYILDEYSFDKFHQHADNLYRIVERQKQAGVYYNFATTPGPLGPGLTVDFPEVRQTCRLGRTRGTIQLGQTIIEPSNIRYTDNSFFSMFSFRLLKGNPARVLLRPDEVVLTSVTAAQLFGNNWEARPDLLGTNVVVTAWGKELVVKVVGVAEPPAANSSIRYSALLSMKILEKEEGFTWDNSMYENYALLDAATDPATFAAKLRTYLDRYSQNNSTDEARTLYIQPMKDIHLHSHFDFSLPDDNSGNIVYMHVFMAVGVMVLLIAVFNFVNLSTARATNRAKEVGIRKVIGAAYRQLITQFLVESFLLTIMAVIASLVIAQLLLPVLNNVSGKALYVPFEIPGFIGVILLMTLGVSLLAGLYPAFHLSSFAPAKVLKGISRIPVGISFRQVLVVGQFTFSVVLVIGAIVIYRQLHFVQQKDLGFNKEQLIYVPLRNKAMNKEAVIKNELKGQSGIVSVAKGSGNIVNADNATTSFRWEGQQPGSGFSITQMNVDADLFSTLGMKLVAGRNFFADTPDSTSFVINETAANRMGWTAQQAIGKTIVFGRTEGNVVGVVKDFHFRSLTVAIEPFIFYSWAKTRFNGVFVRAQPGHAHEAIAAIEKAYKAIDNQTVAHHEFIDQALEAQYREQQNTGSIILFFSILAVIVSCLGLFGLATYATEQRTKEIGIRKVLGASVSVILRLLSADFVKLVFIAIIIATPVAWWGTRTWLQDFAYRIALDWWIFAGAGFITIAIAIATVSYHAIKTAVTNPVDSLRSE